MTQKRLLKPLYKVWPFSVFLCECVIQVKDKIFLYQNIVHNMFNQMKLLRNLNNYKINRNGERKITHLNLVVNIAEDGDHLFVCIASAYR